MPYRRLPTTDVARLKALQACTRMADITPPDRLAFPAGHIHAMRNLISRLEGAKHQQNLSRRHQIAFNREHQTKVLKTKLYLSHFIQVLNFAIIREEIPESARSFYGLETYGNRLPKLRTEADLLEWGKKIIEGENLRIRKGGIPVMMPNISRLKVWFDQFRDSYFNQVTATKSTSRADRKMTEVRREVDSLLVEAWDSIESFHSGMEDEEKRRLAGEYGIVYVERPSEKG